MKTKRTLRSMISALCCLAMLLAWLPVLPAGAASTALAEDFESYSAGSEYSGGAFKASHLANGGTTTNAVAQESGNKYLELTAQNTGSSTAAARNRIHTVDTYSGSYTLEFDYMRVSDAQNTLDVYLRHGGYIRARVTKDGGVQLWVHGNATTGTMKTTTMSGVTLAKNTWYSFKAQVSDTGIRLSVYAKGQTAALGTLEMVQSTDKDADLLAKYNIWFDLNAASTGDHSAVKVGLDNVKVTTGTDPVRVAGDTSGAVIVDGNYVAGGSKQWVFFSEDFSSFNKGDDLMNSNKFSSVYKSSAGYTVAEENGNKYALLTTVHSNSDRAQLTLESKVSGAYTLEFDYMPTSEVKGANFLDAAVQGAAVRLRLGLQNTNRNFLYATGDGLSSSSNLKVDYIPYTWYSVKVVVDAGSVTAKVWPKGESEPANSMTITSSNLPVSSANKPNITLGPTGGAAEEQAEYAIGIDNIRMYKGTDFTMPAVCAGSAGSALELAINYTGQNLSVESPAPQFKWTLGNDQLGSVGARGKLILGPAEGETTLKVDLLDASGNPTGLGGTTKLIVGNNNGLTATPNELIVEEGVVGTTKQISVQVDSAVASSVPNYKLVWSSTNPAVATVDANGLVTFVGTGKTKVMASVQDANGNATSYFANIPVQVGQPPLRILSIGNSHSRDSYYYLSALGAAADKRVEAAFLHKDSGMIRHHAHNLVTETADYYYYKGNPVTGVVTNLGKNTIQAALADGEWDIVMLHQGTTYAGAPGTYTSDIPYIIDYIKAEQPNAKIYWMLGWAYEDDFDETRPGYSHAENFKTYYEGSQAVMYNAFIDCFEQFIWGENAKYGDKIDGWFPTGQAIQNLRATYGDTLTRDGFHLSLTNGRLTSAMTILKVLYPDLDLKEITLDEVSKFLVMDKMENGKRIDTDPDYQNTEANLQLIRDAVNAATADLTKAPKKLPVPKVVKVEDKGTENDLTIGQGTAPIKYFFPDAKTMADGTIYVTAYKNIYHKPSGTAGADMDNMYEGYGTLVGWNSQDNGKTWSDEFVLVDEDKILGWYDAAKAQGDTKSWHNVGTIRNRYDLLAENPGADYTVLADPRDPNLAVVNVDGKDLLVMTFWIAYYAEDVSRTNICYMMWAEQKDGKLGEWSEPIRLTKHNGGDFVKRGDIAVFPNGRILVPFYGNSYGGVEMQWDSAKQTFETTATRDMKGVFSTEESTTLNEISFVAPPNSTGTVFAFVRESGEVLKSEDYGVTWEFYGNQDGLIHQPGFQVVDENRVFMTWAIARGPRDIYGKMIYVNGAFSDTDYQAVYLTPNRKGHDMGDPSSTLMTNGKLLAICYDTEFRSIVGTVVDPDSPVNTPVELNTAVPNGTLFEKDYAGKKLDSTGVTADKAVSGSYTVEASFKLGASGKVTVGGVTVTADKITCGDKSAAVSLAADTQTYLRISMVGTSGYIKVWQGTEPAGWTMGAANAVSGKVTVTGAEATLDTVKISRRVLINMPETMSASASFTMQCDIMPAVSDVTWTSSNEKVVTVKNGEVTVVAPGQADITVTAGGVSKVCKVMVNEPPAQLSGKGERVVIFSDDFQSYSSGNLWEQMKANGYNTSTTGESGNASTLVLDSDGSEKYLKLNGKSSWIRVDKAITGDYTAQFDFKFGGNGTLYATLNQGKGDTYDTRAFVHLVKGSSNGTRIQYDLDGVATNYPNDPAMHGPLSEKKGFGTDTWYTAKFTRADQSLYVKIWEQGTDEPAAWGQYFSTEAFDTELAANQGTFFRMQWADASAMYIDNLTITQQQGKGADFMLDVPGSAWYRDAVDYAIKNGIMSGYNAISFGPNDTLSRAMVVQVLYNKEGQPAITGTHKFPDVKSGDWFNNAVTWGSQKGVVGGYGDGRFGPNDAVTIQQIAVILWNYSGNPKFTGTPDGVGTYDDWAKNGLSWAVENGILKNVPMQNATEKATRAQTAQMLMNYLSK